MDNVAKERIEQAAAIYRRAMNECAPLIKGLEWVRDQVKAPADGAAAELVRLQKYTSEALEVAEQAIEPQPTQDAQPD